MISQYFSISQIVGSRRKLRKLEHIGSVLSKGFVILWATAIFWFYLGNLINFHQNRIWGKFLIPACFTHSSVNNKDFGTLQHTGLDSFSTPGFDLEGINDLDCTVSVGVFRITQLTQNTINETAKYRLVVAGFSFRGPPVA